MVNKKYKKRILVIGWILVILILGAMIAYNNPLDDPKDQLLKKVCSCLLIAGAAVLFTVWYDRVALLAADLWHSRHLIWRLSKNDFRKRYAGSYLGVVWSLVPPVVTVAMYYVVFTWMGSGRQQVSAGIDVPYVLFLTAGLVPWFFFSDALPGGTSSLMEYDYLVKKVVFKVSILPMIKVNAAVFTHVGFTAILLIISMLFGYLPSVYWLQLIYYTFCEYLLVLGLVYTTSAIVVFFRDLQQIIAIVMQVGMWATPILWNMNMLGPKGQVIIKLNPMTYIVQGYRSAIYGRTWFWSDVFSTTYFWIITALLFVIGAAIFKRLKPQFADVL